MPASLFPFLPSRRGASFLSLRVRAGLHGWLLMNRPGGGGQVIKDIEDFLFTLCWITCTGEGNGLECEGLKQLYGECQGVRS